MTQVNFVLDSETHTKFKKLCKNHLHMKIQDKCADLVKDYVTRYGNELDVLEGAEKESSRVMASVTNEVAAEKPISQVPPLESNEYGEEPKGDSNGQPTEN